MGSLGMRRRNLDRLLGPCLALGILVLDLDALDQVLEGGGIAFGVLVDLDLLLVGELLIGVDGLPHQAEGALELDLILALGGRLAERQGGHGQGGHDGQDE